MVRKLSNDPEKRRHQLFRRLYNYFFEWGALIEAEGTSHFLILPGGEEVYRGDLLVGLESLSENHKLAFTLICLQGMTESQACEEGFGRIVPVQQWADAALKKMVKAYDEQQSGGYLSPDRKKRLEELKRIHQEQESSDSNMSVENSGTTLRLGSRQRVVVEWLQEGHVYTKNCGWKYSSHSETVEILDSLVERGLVSVEPIGDGKSYTLTIEFQ